MLTTAVWPAGGVQLVTSTVAPGDEAGGHTQ